MSTDEFDAIFGEYQVPGDAPAEDAPAENKVRIHISVDSLNNISNKELKAVNAEMEKLVSEAIKENEELTIKKAFSGGFHRDTSMPQFGMNFSLANLNLQPEIESKLSKKLAHYGKKRGLVGNKLVRKKHKTDKGDKST